MRKNAHKKRQTRNNKEQQQKERTTEKNKTSATTTRRLRWRHFIFLLKTGPGDIEYEPTKIT